MVFSTDPAAVVFQTFSIYLNYALATSHCLISDGDVRF